MNLRIKYQVRHLIIGLLITSLFSELIIFTGGCAAQPKGMEKPKALSQTEQNIVIKVALSTPEAKQMEEKESKYSTALSWVAIVWRDSKAAEIRYLPFDHPEADSNYSLVPKEAAWYPNVVIRFGEPSNWIVQVAVDVETGKTVYVMSSPDLSGPGRFPTPPIVDNGGFVVGEIKAITSMSTGYLWQLEILVRSVGNLDSLPNPIGDKVGQVITCRTNEDASTLKVGQGITANVKLSGDVERGTILYIYSIK